MKTLLLIISLIYCLNISSQIKPICSVEVGYNKKIVRMYEKTDVGDMLAIDRKGQYTNLTIGAEYKRLKLITETKTYMNYNGNVGFSPWLSIYTIDLQYKIKRLTIGINHHCGHFVQSNKAYDFVYSDVEDNVFVKYDLFN